jgi:hypothetical protein
VLNERTFPAQSLAIRWVSRGEDFRDVLQASFLAQAARTVYIEAAHRLTD